MTHTGFIGLQVHGIGNDKKKEGKGRSCSNDDAIKGGLVPVVVCSSKTAWRRGTHCAKKSQFVQKVQFQPYISDKSISRGSGEILVYGTIQLNCGGVFSPQCPLQKRL